MQPVTVTMPSVVRPVTLAPGSSASTICFISTDGSPWCFGDNSEGELGNGLIDDTWGSTPTSPSVNW